MQVREDRSFCKKSIVVRLKAKSSLQTVKALVAFAAVQLLSLLLIVLSGIILDYPWDSFSDPVSPFVLL